MDKIKVILFAMTGFGNNALKILTDIPFIDMIAVFTPAKQDPPFPYYRCEKLEAAVRRKGILLFEGLSLKDEETRKIIKKLAADLIIVGSFNQILPRSVISLPKIGVINVHPSLLPKYRGATPTAWALMNGEKETGVTVHFIDDETVDAGRIIIQEKLKIGNTDTDGILRKRLAEFSEKVLKKALYAIRAKSKRSFIPQNREKITYYPKRTLNDAKIDINSPFGEIVRKIKAFTPYPGARLERDGKEFIVNKVIRIRPKKAPTKNKKNIDVKGLHGMLRFQITKKNPR